MRPRHGDRSVLIRSFLRVSCKRGRIIPGTMLMQWGELYPVGLTRSAERTFFLQNFEIRQKESMAFFFYDCNATFSYIGTKILKVK